MHGLIGEFAAPDRIVAAARQLNDSGFRRIDAYTPYPVPQLDQILPSAPRVRLPLIVVAGALLGALCGYFVQVWAAVIDYPLNIGGRPYHSWPAFTVSAFEITLLFAITAGFVQPVLRWSSTAVRSASRPSRQICVPGSVDRFDRSRSILSAML